MSWSKNRSKALDGEICRWRHWQPLFGPPRADGGFTESQQATLDDLHREADEIREAAEDIACDNAPFKKGLNRETL